MVGVVVWGTLVFGWFRVLISLLVRVVRGRGWKMLVGKSGWRKGLYGLFGVCTRE